MDTRNFPSSFPCFKALALAVAVGSAVSVFAVPNGYIQEWVPPTSDQQPYYNFRQDIDFSKASAAFPSRNFSTWISPSSGQTVDFFPQMLNSDFTPTTGTCFDVSSGGSAGSDPVIYVNNRAGAWVILADDNAGNNQFRARIFAQMRSQNEVRISPYFSSGTNDNITLNISKIKAVGGASITPGSCRLSGVPYWENNLNDNNPYP